MEKDHQKGSFPLPIISKIEEVVVLIIKARWLKWHEVLNVDILRHHYLLVRMKSHGLYDYLSLSLMWMITTRSSHDNKDSYYIGIIYQIYHRGIKYNSMQP